jgi:hypothetical protein
MTKRIAGLKGVRAKAVALLAALPIVSAGLSSCTLVTGHSGAIGSYVPTALSTGVPAGTRLMPHYGNITITKPNTVISGLDVWGFITVKAAGVIIMNSRIHGNGPARTDTGLINVLSPSAKRVLIENCELTHAYPSPWVDGIIGHDFTVIRSNIHNVVDGIGVMNPFNRNANLNVNITGNYIHDLNYMSPDPEQHDGHTHNDGIQIQGTGSSVGVRQVTIYGNNIAAFAGPLSNHRSPYYPAVTGQAIGVTPNVSSVHDILIDHNWVDGGAQSVTMIPGPRRTGSGLVLINTHFGNRQALVNRNGVRARRPVLIYPGVSVATGGNVYSNGSVIRIWH